MYVDKLWDLGIPAITTSNNTTPTTNVHDNGASEIVFGDESPHPVEFVGSVTLTAGTSPTVRVDFIGSDEADLDADNSEESNTIIASTGIIDMKDDGSGALASGDTVKFRLKLFGQRVARRYYGGLLTLGGTNPSCSAGQGIVVMDPHTNL